MSKSEKKSELIDGSEGDSNHVELLKRMIAEEVTAIYLEYSGSGDSGAVDVTNGYTQYDATKIEYSPYDMIYDKDNRFQKELSEETKVLAEDLTLEITQADFNNDGSSGTAIFFIDGSSLRFKANHSTYYTASEDTNFDEELVDGTLI